MNSYSFVFTMNVEKNIVRSGRAICNSRNQRASEVEGRLRQEAADCIAQIAQYSQAQGEGATS